MGSNLDSLLTADGYIKSILGIDLNSNLFLLLFWSSVLYCYFRLFIQVIFSNQGLIGFKMLMDYNSIISDRLTKSSFFGSYMTYYHIITFFLVYMTFNAIELIYPGNYLEYYFLISLVIPTISALIFIRTKSIPEVNFDNKLDRLGKYTALAFLLFIIASSSYSLFSIYFS